MIGRKLGSRPHVNAGLKLHQLAGVKVHQWETREGLHDRKFRPSRTRTSADRHRAKRDAGSGLD